MVDKLIVWHKELNTYLEGGAVYIKFNIGNPDVVGKGGGGDIGVQVGVTYGAANVL